MPARASNADPIDNSVLSQISQEATNENYSPELCAWPIENSTVKIRGASFDWFNQDKRPSFFEAFASKNDVALVQSGKLLRSAKPFSLDQSTVFTYVHWAN